MLRPMTRTRATIHSEEIMMCRAASTGQAARGFFSTRPNTLTES